MNITIKDKSTGATKVPVNIKKHIKDMTVDEIIEKYNLYEDLLDYHYYVCQEYKNTDDVASEGMIEHISEVLYEAEEDEDFDYYSLAKDIMSELEDKIIDEILVRDDDAKDYYETVNSALRGNY